ncbi:VOC family protein [Fictibacillus phosphorivorans]|uniref:VOC family protein n=1 Tax=Fictibacillus phosphorivorans TaxID=1221500 RepID=UPI00203FFC14|nr:VOC family protein [Fictibacillus phosphorivorans]MCM3718304.1 VOC family protein [Fictibacillus phosphorivorans]MCM3775832.1 VOC family protein [Fictibacillus phosphorivorans]
MKPIHKDTHIGNVTLKVRDLEKLIQFYTETIGLKLLTRTNSAAQLTADGKTPLLTLEGDPTLKQRPVRSAGLYHLALLVPTRKDLANVLQYFIQAGTRLAGASNHQFSEAIYLQDPENNGIEIYRDVDRKDWVRDEKGKLPAISEPLDLQSLLHESDNKKWKGLPERTVMGHVHLNVTNIPEAEAFYMNVLGFEEQTRMAHHALFISAGGYHHHIALNIWNGPDAIPTPMDATGLLHYEIVVPSAEVFVDLKHSFEEHDIPYRAESNRIFVKDPAGNGIVIKNS